MNKLFIFFTALITLLGAESRSYVGDSVCKACHAKEFKDWQGSDHDLAMMKATSKSVKGDFNNAVFNYNEITTTFYKDGENFMVRTDGEDGKLQDFKISYTFGVYPLQQYMIDFPNGRIQVLDIAWDSRSKDEGGQRWYHLHPDDNVTYASVLHWTGPNLNWNYMCADCHSTNLKKNYNFETKSYHTTWTSINVSCEACHGPASKHIEWTKDQTKQTIYKGFPLSLQYKMHRWDVNTTTSKLKRNNTEIEVCAKCHSRRTQLDDNYIPGDKYSDHYLSVQLNEGLYYPDGKIQDEVYVYNSFRQSKMYAKGITCSDCHNPHTLQRRATGDKVCLQCHQQEKYTSTIHHKHDEDSKGASCIECHMPARTYMGVDSRNDHSFRIPRPDLSIGNHRPNACNNCHKHKDATWASDAIKKWFGKIPVGKQDFSHSIDALRKNSQNAPKELYNILMSDAPDIAKATAVSYLGNYPSQQTYMTVLQMLRNSDVDIRRTALQALESFPVQLRVDETFNMLEDEHLTVRMEAARQLASYPMNSLDDQRKTVLKKSLEEYERILNFSADRPESQLSLAMLYRAYKELPKAEKAYKEALRTTIKVCSCLYKLCLFSSK